MVHRSIARSEAAPPVVSANRKIQPQAAKPATQDFEAALLDRCKVLGLVPLDVVRAYPDVFEYHTLGATPAWFIVCKRTVDIAVALVALLLTAPLALIIAFAIRLDSAGPLMQSKVMLGKHGEPFRLWSFRTTSPQANVTRVGGFLRQSRMEMLPQLWNILTGHMSLIGPRPVSPAFFERTEQSCPEFRLRFAGKPGLTGWQQISQPSNVAEVHPDKMLERDLLYLRCHTIRLELKVALRATKRYMRHVRHAVTQ